MKKLSIFLVVLVGATLEFQASNPKTTQGAEVFQLAIQPPFAVKMGLLCRTIGIKPCEIYSASDEELCKTYGTSEKAKFLTEFIEMRKAPEFQIICKEFEKARSNPSALSNKQKRNLHLCESQSASEKNDLHKKLLAVRNKLNERSGRKK